MNPDGANFCGGCGSALPGGGNVPVNSQPWMHPGNEGDVKVNYVTPKRKPDNRMMVYLGAGLAVVVVGLLVWIVVMVINKPKQVIEDDDDDDIELVSTTHRSAVQAPSQATPGGAGTSGIDNIANMDFSSSYVSESWLSGLTKAERRVARNAIYARHGRYFKSADLQQIFGRCSWYSPYRNEIPVQELNKFERANIKTIQAWE